MRLLGPGAYPLPPNCPPSTGSLNSGCNTIVDGTLCGDGRWCGSGVLDVGCGIIGVIECGGINPGKQVTGVLLLLVLVQLLLGVRPGVGGGGGVGMLSTSIVVERYRDGPGRFG